MNLANIAATKYATKHAMDLAELRINKLDVKISTETEPKETERMERLKRAYIGVAIVNRQKYMELLYLVAHMTQKQRIQVGTLTPRPPVKQP